jgi:N-acyl-D-aspartate/D-glutamate deacylase
VDVLYSDLPLHEAFKAAKALRLPLILTKLEEAEEEDFKQATQQQIGYFLSQKMHPRALIRAGDACDAFLHFLTHAPLEAAVHRLTGFPAQALGLIGRGVLQEGAFADLVLFDPTQPYENCIQALWVNGVLSFSRGQLTNAVAGHLITRNEMKRLRSS